MESQVSIRDRWLGALSYLAFLVVIPAISPAKSDFLVRHVRQGLAVFFLEVLGVVLIAIIDSTLGKIPLLGFLLAILLRLAFFLTFLVISAMGFAKALFGESWRIPYVDEWAERLPIE